MQLNELFHMDTPVKSPGDSQIKIKNISSNQEGSLRPISSQYVPKETIVLTSIAIDWIFLFLNFCV